MSGVTRVRRPSTAGGSDEGARRAATIYSLLGSCALAGVSPKAYLTWVLDEIQVQRFPVSRIDELLPLSYAQHCPDDARIPSSR